MLYPILLGAGKRLFAESAKTSKLRLMDTVKAGDAVVLVYQTVRAAVGDATENRHPGNGAVSDQAGSFRKPGPPGRHTGRQTEVSDAVAGKRPE